jgi:hypothetical protein
MKNYKICFSVLLFSAGCSTADGITGFQKWKHPSTGKANLLADRKECERIAKGNHTYVSVESSADRAGRNLGRMFYEWDYTKECLIGKGYIKEE